MRTFLWCAAALFGMTMVAAASRTGGACVSVILILAVPALMIGYLLHADRQKQAREQKAREDALSLVRAAAERAQRALQDARDKYRLALATIDDHPTDLEARKAALKLGRALAELARTQAGGQGRALFDEVELQNDLAIRIGVAAAAEGKALPRISAKCANCGARLSPGAERCSYCDHRARLPS